MPTAKYVSLQLLRTWPYLTQVSKQCMLLIARLSKLGGIGTGAARIELANAIHESLKDAEQELELLATQVDDEVPDGSSNSAALNSKINKLAEDMKMYVPPSTLSSQHSRSIHNRSLTRLPQCPPTIP